MKDRLLDRLSREIKEKHGCHTLILYGSRARGQGTSTSDYDLLGFRKSERQMIHDSRKIGHSYLDAFIYSDKRLKIGDIARNWRSRSFSKGRFWRQPFAAAKPIV